MTQHTHVRYVPGCFRCSLSREEDLGARRATLDDAADVLAKYEAGHFRDGISPGYQTLVFDLLADLVTIAEYRQSR